MKKKKDKSTQIFFSIILPTYNRAHKVEQAIRSALDQTYRNFELIIVDDGSQDGTVQLIQNKYKFEIRSQKIRLFQHGTNKGAPCARNEGLRRAQHEWIAYLDSDNEMRPVFLEKFRDTIIRNPKCNFFYCKAKKSVSEEEIGQPFDFAKLLHINYIDLGAIVHSRSLVGLFGDFDESLTRLMDWDIILRYARRDRTHFIDKVLLDYYDGDDRSRITCSYDANTNYKSIVLKVLCTLDTNNFRTLYNKHYYENEQHKTEVRSLQSQKEDLQERLDKIYSEVHLLKSSKFWKLRNRYIHIKHNTIFIFCNPRKFFNKHYKKNQQLLQQLQLSIHEEGWRKALLRVRNYILHGKGVLNKNVLDENAKDQAQMRYLQWIKNVERPCKKSLYQDHKKILKDFSYTPQISIVMPVYNSDEIFLRKAIFSVINQLYTNWELCIVDDCSTKKIIKKILDDFIKKDTRIKVFKTEENGGISKATNLGVKKASGEFVGLLDHDDELVPETLMEYVKKLGQNKKLDFIYSDNDMIDVYGNRYNPKFKPDWSPELLLSYAYTSHFKFYRKSLFMKCGGFKEEYDGAQDYEFNLRLTEKTKNIGHIPKILYHWRAVPGSTAVSASEKPLSLENGRKALDDTLRRRKIPGSAIIPEFAKKSNVGIYKIDFDAKEYTDPVTIIIPTKDRVDLLSRCIKSIKEKTNYPSYKILVINNNSIESETYKYLESEKDVEYFDIKTEKFNYAHINNIAVKKTNTDLIVFMNNDVEVIASDWLLEMVGAIRLDKENGAIGARLIYSDKRIQHAGVLLGLHDMSAGHANKLIQYNNGGYLNYSLVMRNYSAVTAACMLTRREIFEKVGGFDEKNLAVAYNDVDYCLRVGDSGYRIIYNPYALLYHHEGKTRGFVDNIEEVRYLKKQWKEKIKDDPYYNPNLSLEDEQFRIKTEEKK